ncbi:hypothetical protein RclHR1_03870018 [Rhizophagus clarus]|uniref:Uncharacterized protein n=1 Tax=Rhizophagus clarus TaxID=94130 RepID=A0A2Z6RD63_9GLOM|nr:hypothetical protein RclHR1_03870018 [Rhizophagus clarus]GET02023.1 hypothetical protein RCL_jg15635.t1 [Rhizophagus clarus]
MEKGSTSCTVDKQVLGEGIKHAIEEFFYEEIIDIFSKLLRNMSNDIEIRNFILRCLKDQDRSTIKELQQEKYRFERKDYSLEIFGFILALNHHVSSSAWTYILIENDIMDASDDSDNHTSDDEQPITISCSSTTANKSKLVITLQAPEEEMDISFTEKDQPALQLHITNVDQPKTDSFTKKNKKKRKKKKSRQNQSQKANQMTQPIPSSSSSNPSPPF